LTSLTRNKRFATVRGFGFKNQDYMCYRAMMRVRKLSLVRCLVWVVVVFGSGTALAKTDGSGDPGWPREHARDGNRLLVYQPQVDDWKNLHDLTWRMAVSLTPKGGEEAVGVPHSGHRIAIADELIDLASQKRAIVGCP
jgi:hypothetical protein